MKFRWQLIWKFIIVIAVAAISALCYHSIEEIHYLKTFFPGEFTVREAFYASAVELIKVAIAGLPLLIIIALCVIAVLRKQNGQER